MDIVPQALMLLLAVVLGALVGILSVRVRRVTMDEAVSDAAKTATRLYARALAHAQAAACCVAVATDREAVRKALGAAGLAPAVALVESVPAAAPFPSVVSRDEVEGVRTGLFEVIDGALSHAAVTEAGITTDSIASAVLDRLRKESPAAVLALLHESLAGPADAAAEEAS